MPLVHFSLSWGVLSQAGLPGFVLFRASFTEGGALVVIGVIFLVSLGTYLLYILNLPADSGTGN